MEYAVVIHHDEGSAYGVTVPDLPGCFPAGDTFHHALENVKEAIELHLEGLAEEAMEILRPTQIDARHKNRSKLLAEAAL